MKQQQRSLRLYIRMFCDSVIYDSMIPCAGILVPGGIPELWRCGTVVSGYCGGGVQLGWGWDLGGPL